MVVIKQYPNDSINQLISVTGRILYDSTLNVLRYNNSQSYSNIVMCKDDDNNLSGVNDIITTGKIGINTTTPYAQVEINSETGSCLRLTYNDNDGDATNYSDLSVTSSGVLTLTPSSGLVNISTHDGSTSGLQLAGTLITADADDINKLDDVTPGIAVEGKAMVFDVSKNIVGINYIETSDFVSIKTAESDNGMVYPASLIGIPPNAAAVGLGTGLEFNSVNNTGDIYNAGYVNLVSSDITSGSESCYFDFKLANVGVIDSIMTVSNNGVVSATSYVETSDIRYKENINDISEDFSYGQILKVNVKSYNYIKDSEKHEYSGVIAQELKEIFPSAVIISKNDDVDDFHQVRYNELIPHLVNCIKKLNSELEVVNKRLEDMEKK